MNVSRRRYMGAKGESISYQQVEYLESTGTQYIETGIIPDANTGIYINATNSDNTERYMFGLRNDSGNTRWTVGHTSSGYYYGYGTYLTPSINPASSAEIKLNYLNDKKFHVRANGETVSADLPSLSFTPAYNIRLFGSAGRVSEVSIWKGRLYAAKITQGSNIVMNLIPVRIGQVGYMYDTVSGELFGNAGTDAFLLGGDIDADYNRDGLVFWLDGIVKGGNSTGWRDLIGGAFFAYNSHSTENADYVNFDGNGYIKSDISVAYPWDTSTIEVCFERELNNAASVLFFPNRHDTICFVLNADNTNVIPYNGSSNHPCFNNIQYPNKSTISVNQSPLIVTNGFQPSYELGNNYYGSVTNGLATVGGRATDGGYSMRPFKGKIYSIRIYNRLLSANEMIYNQRVDNQRFNLGLNI